MKQLHHAFDIVHLLRGAQKAGINGIQMQTHGLPVPEKTRHGIGQIDHLKSGEIGIGGQNRRRQRAYFNAACREHGQRNRQRAFSESGNVVNRGDTRQNGVHRAARSCLAGQRQKILFLLYHRVRFLSKPLFKAACFGK